MSTTDETYDDREELEHVERLTARVNSKAAAAVSWAATLETTTAPTGHLLPVQIELANTYAATCKALDSVERAIDDYDNGHGTPMPRRIIDDHSQRFRDHYDGPVLNVAVLLLEANRRKWLHAKRETIGAQNVERHGLTENQQHWLTQLQDAWQAKDHVYDPRTIDDDQLSNILQTVVTEAGNENWGNVRVNLERALDRTATLENGGDETDE